MRVADLVARVNNPWQVVVIVIYGIVQVTTSLNPNTAPYSLLSLFILAFLGVVIIIAGRKQPINAYVESLNQIIEWIEEYKQDLMYEMSDISDDKQKNIYNSTIKGLDIRLKTFKNALKYADKQKIRRSDLLF